MNVARRVGVIAAAMITAGGIAMPAGTVAKTRENLLVLPVGHCIYKVKDSPTPVRAHPSRASRVVRWKYDGQIVTGPCVGTTTIGGGPAGNWTEVYCSAGPHGRAWINDVHLATSVLGRRG